jgi:hypothetical protein
MKLIEIEFLFTFIGSCLGIISAVLHFVGAEYPALLYVSVFCLFAAKWVELIDRVEVEK